MEILNGKVTDAKIKNQPLMFHGEVELRRGGISKKCHLYLYRDFLVVTNSRYKITFKIKYVIPLTSLWIGDCVDTDFVGPNQARKSIFLGWPMENFIATFRSVNQKRDWWCFLERSIKQTKEKYHGMSTALEIFTDDIPSSNTSFTVTATHLDTVNDIIMKLQPLLGIPNAEEDYQLWFSSGKEEAPCPLLGHENPYAIKMSELRNEAFMALGPSNYTAYLNIQKVIQEMQAPHVPGKLILKPKESPQDHQQSNAEKTVRRRSLLSRIFRRLASTCQDCACFRAPAPTPGRLFNNPLGVICQDGNLPTSILTMLSLLEETGPAVEGIFRKSGSIVECQDVKDKLDLGEEVDLREKSILVVSSLLKDFLRNIPGGVFLSSLYDKWMAVTDLDNEKERISSIQSLLEQLPTPNAVLLRQLFQVLHRIERHSSTNYMTSYNLSVCMAPSLLCLPNPSMLELGKEISKQISLVQFFIVNFEKIFEDNTNIHLGESSVMPSNGKKNLDTSINGEESLDKSINGKETLYTSINSEDNLDTPINIEQTLDISIKGEDNLDTPINIEETLDISINGEDNLDTPINIEETLDISINGEDNLDTPINIEETLNISINGEDNLDISIKDKETLDISINSEDNLDTPINIEETLDISIKGEDNLDTPINIEETLDISIKGEDNLDTPINIEETLNISINGEDNLDISIKDKETLDISINSEDNLDTPINIEETLDISINSEDNLDTPINVEETLDMSINSEDNLDTPINIEETLNISINGEDNLDISIKDKETLDISINSEDNLDTPINIEETLDISIKGEDNLDTPINIEETLDISIKGEDNLDTPNNIEETLDISIKGEDNLDTPFNVEETLGISINGEDNVDTPFNVEETLVISINVEESLDISINGEDNLDVSINGEDNLDVSINGEDNLDIYINGEESLDTPINIEESLEISIGLREMDAAQDGEKTCASEKTHPIVDAEPQHPPAALHVGECRDAETTVRRSTLLSQIFRRGASTCHDCVSSRAPAPTPGRLFNNPLGAICQDGNLPTSILTMLTLLEETGPAVEGIFSKSGSIAECQDIKDKLDLGEEVDLREKSILVVSSVLKDFLRNIPGGVFLSSLYDKWMAVTDLDNEKERISSIQSLLEQLPTPNVVLLRQLFQVLHRIERHSSTNYMTSYNLSVCMAPSLLCLPNPSMLELGKEISKQISLVQFFIKNFEKIFEDNTNIHLGESSVMPSNSKESLDTSINCKETLDVSIKGKETLDTSSTCKETLDTPINVEETLDVSINGEDNLDIYINGEESLDTPINVEESFGLREMDAAQDDEKTCASEKTHPSVDAELRHPPAALHDGECTDAENTVRRRSLLSRIFRRGASTCHDCASSCAPASTSGRLFNNPLGAICQDGNLPTSILTMLSLLEEMGPAVEGIFSKSGSIAECQDIKDKLDLGEEVDLREKSILVVSSVLKDFLRNIPGGVFSFSLYDKWMAVTDLDNEKERISSIQSLLEQLPTPNVVLLRQLFQVLHRIERHSSTNYMTSYNLSVCMAPSLLCLPNPSMLELGKEISKQISLVKFLIENFEKIFEDNTNIHLGESPVMPSKCEETFDTSISLREMDAAQDDEKTCASEKTHPSGDSEPWHPPAAPHVCVCSVVPENTQMTSAL